MSPLLPILYLYLIFSHLSYAFLSLPHAVHSSFSFYLFFFFCLTIGSLVVSVFTARFSTTDCILTTPFMFLTNLRTKCDYFLSIIQLFVFLLATHFVLCELWTESLHITQIYICLHGINVTLHFMVLIILRPHPISLSFILQFNHSIHYLSLLSIFLHFVSYILILGEFVKLRKATVSFVMSVRLSICLSVYPSVREKQRRSHWKNCHEIL